MLFSRTDIPGVLLISLEPAIDERGAFARCFCKQEFERQSLRTHVIQCNVSFNKKKGTLRGMHYQIAPHAEAKMVRCTRGAVYDVALDLRLDSPTFRKWEFFELTPDNGAMLYIPEGVAHGFQTLKDNSEVFYHMFSAYEPSYARGVRWDDALFGIEWPETGSRIISDRDQNYPDFEI